MNLQNCERERQSGDHAHTRLAGIAEREREREMVVTNDSWDLRAQYLSHLCLIDGPSHLMKHLSLWRRVRGGRQGLPTRLTCHDSGHLTITSRISPLWPPVSPLTSPARLPLCVGAAICWLWQAAPLWVDGQGSTRVNYVKYQHKNSHMSPPGVQDWFWHHTTTGWSPALITWTLSIWKVQTRLFWQYKCSNHVKHCSVFFENVDVVS